MIGRQPDKHGCAADDGEHEDEIAEYRASLDAWRDAGNLPSIESTRPVCEPMDIGDVETPY